MSTRIFEVEYLYRIQIDNKKESQCNKEKVSILAIDAIDACNKVLIKLNKQTNTFKDEKGKKWKYEYRDFDPINVKLLAETDNL